MSNRETVSKILGAWIARYDAAKAARSTSAMQADWFNRYQRLERI